MASRRIEDLHPQMQPLVRQWLADCVAAGYEVLVYFTRRSLQEQAALYAQGRQSLKAVNGLRAVVEWAPLVVKENANIVTRARAGESWHNWDLALDFVPLRADRKPAWVYTPSDPHDVYDEVAALAKECGLQWGGDWVGAFKDYGHIEWHPGISLVDAQRAARDGIPLVLTA